MSWQLTLAVTLALLCFVVGRTGEMPARGEDGKNAVRDGTELEGSRQKSAKYSYFRS